MIFFNCDFFKFFSGKLLKHFESGNINHILGDRQQLRQILDKNVGDSEKVGKNISLFDLILI